MILGNLNIMAAFNFPIHPARLLQEGNCVTMN